MHQQHFNIDSFFFFQHAFFLFPEDAETRSICINVFGDIYSTVNLQSSRKIKK